MRRLRVVLTNFGTTGDVRPLFALGHELSGHGHSVLLAIPPRAAAEAVAAGIESVPVGPEMGGLQDEVNLKMTGEVGIYHSGDRLYAALAPLAAAFESTVDRLSESCRDADVLVSGPAQPVARMIHELSGIPWVSIQVSNFGGFGGAGLREAGDRLLNPLRRRLGLPSLADPLTTGANSSQLSLYAMSAHLTPRPPEWPSYYHVTGFFFEPDGRFEPDPALAKFLETGPAPVVVTLGSMVHGDGGPVEETVLRAIRRAGRRAILQSRARATGLHGDDVYCAAFVPHGWLLPRAACVVLHGGSGSTAATVRSGIPGVFIPHGDLYDQTYWATLAEDAGCAPPAVPLADLDEDRLTSAISIALRDETMRSRAAELARRIRREPGVRLARELIEQLAAETGVGAAAPAEYGHRERVVQRNGRRTTSHE